VAAVVTVESVLAEREAQAAVEMVLMDQRVEQMELQILAVALVLVISSTKKQVVQELLLSGMRFKEKQ
jgi:hypothetical protein